jgi:Alpha-2-macroglobulin RAP, C-terminal domain
MFSPDDTDFNTSTGPIDRSARVAYRREIINEKRQRHTDMLPKIDGEISNAKTTSRQIAQLREENKRFRWKIDELQHLIYQYRQTQAQLEREIDNLQSSRQNDIEQYEIHLREAIEERNQLEETNQELKQRYQELDRSFHENVSEEAQKMVSEAANTIVLTPEHTPPLLRDVAKTVELHMKQTEDQHVAELLLLIRQAQYKSDLLELELANEREKIASERQNLFDQQASISEKAQYRYTTMQKHLQAHWTLVLTLMAAFLLILVPVFQLVFVAMKFPLDIAIFVPVVICIGIAFLIARAYTNKKVQDANKKLEQKANTKPSQLLASTPKKT